MLDFILVSINLEFYSLKFSFTEVKAEKVTRDTHAYSIYKKPLIYRWPPSAILLVFRIHVE